MPLPPTTPTPEAAPMPALVERLHAIADFFDAQPDVFIPEANDCRQAAKGK